MVVEGRARRSRGSRSWEQGGRNLGIRLRGKSGLRGRKRAKCKSQTAQNSLRSDSCAVWLLTPFSAP